MIRKFVAVLLLGFLYILPLQAAEKPMALTTDQDKASYVFGRQIGMSLMRQGIDPNFDVLIQAIKETYDNKPARFTDTPSVWATRSRMLPP